jgi:hypothetical protein
LFHRQRLTAENLGRVRATVPAVGSKTNGSAGRRAAKRRNNVPAAIKAAQDILDRNGIGVGGKAAPSTVVQVSQQSTHIETGPINTDHVTDEQLDAGVRFIDRLREAIAKIPET